MSKVQFKLEVAVWCKTCGLERDGTLMSLGNEVRYVLWGVA